MQIFSYDDLSELAMSSIAGYTQVYITWTEEDIGKTWTILPDDMPYAVAYGKTFVVGSDPVKYANFEGLFLSEPHSTIGYEGLEIEKVQDPIIYTIKFNSDIPDSLGNIRYDIIRTVSGKNSDYTSALLGTYTAAEIAAGKATFESLTAPGTDNNTSPVYTYKVIARNPGTAIAATSTFTLTDTELTVTAPRYPTVNTPKLTYPDMPSSVIDSLENSDLKYELVKPDGTVVKSFTPKSVLNGTTIINVTASDIDPWTLKLMNGDGDVLSEEQFEVPHTDDATELPIPTDYLKCGNRKPIIGTCTTGDVITSYDPSGEIFDTIVYDEDGDNSLFVPENTNVFVENETTGATTYVDGTDDDAVIDFGDISSANQYKIYTADKEDIIAKGTVVDGELQKLPSFDEFQELPGNYYWVELENYDKTKKTTTTVSEYVAFVNPEGSDEVLRVIKATLPLRGDVNLDGVVDSKDVVFMQNYLIDRESLTDLQYIAADYVQDGYVDVFDLQALRVMLTENDLLEYNGTVNPTLKLPEATIYGDANCDGDVDIADVVAVSVYVQDSEGTNLTDQGKANADVDNIGNGVDDNDALLIQQYAIGATDTLPV
jgi:hypothetical protein